MGGDSEEEIPAATWEAWNKLLTPAALGRLSATKQVRGAAVRHDVSFKTPEEQAAALYSLAVELRDRLRYSSRRVARLKEELSKTQELAQQQVTALVSQATQQQGALAAALESERAQAAARLADFEAEIARLSQGVAGQVSSMEQQQAAVRQLQAELAAVRQQAQQYQAAAREAEQRAAQAEEDRRSLEHELQELRAEVEEAGERAAHHQKQHVDAMGALLATKSRVGELHQVESLYRAARDELARLDKENGELKDMLNTGVDTLTRSRILESAATGKARSTPLFLTPEQQGKSRSAVTGHKAGSAGKAAALLGGLATDLGYLSLKGSGGRLADVVYDDAMVPYPGTASPGARRALSPALASAAASGGLPGAALPGLAWLGPPSAAYGPDPEKYMYLRVAGGYAPKYAGVSEQPKASGWVPKEVVRLVQAFRHAYGIHEPEWRFWEPLLLMVDEVYRGQAGAAVLHATTRGREKLQAMKRQVQAAATYPGVLQAGRIAYLKRKLETMRKTLASRDYGSDAAMRTLMEKEYHLTNQLDAAVDENVALRSSLRQLDELYAAEVQEGGAGSRK